MPFCSLEYLSGGSLAKKIGGKPRRPAEAAQIVATLASAMAAAHARQHHPPRFEAGQRFDRR